MNRRLRKVLALSALFALLNSTAASAAREIRTADSVERTDDRYTYTEAVVPAETVETVELAERRFDAGSADQGISPEPWTAEITRSATLLAAHEYLALAELAPTAATSGSPQTEATEIVEANTPTHQNGPRPPPSESDSITAAGADKNRRTPELAPAWTAEDIAKAYKALQRRLDDTEPGWDRDSLQTAAFEAVRDLRKGTLTTDSLGIYLNARRSYRIRDRNRVTVRRMGRETPLQDESKAAANDNAADGGALGLFQLSPEELAIRREEQAHLQAWVTSVLKSLKPRDRKIVELHYYDNESQRHIAKILSISDDTVHRTLERVEKRFRAAHGARFRATVG